MPCISPMILPEISDEIPAEWTKACPRPSPGFSLAQALDLKIKHEGMLAKSMEEVGRRYFLQRTDGTQGQISEDDHKQIEDLIMKAAESGLESDHRALLEFVFSATYIGLYDPEPRVIGDDC